MIAAHLFLAFHICSVFQRHKTFTAKTFAAVFYDIALQNHSPKKLFWPELLPAIKLSVPCAPFLCGYKKNKHSLIAVFEQQHLTLRFPN